MEDRCAEEGPVKLHWAGFAKWFICIWSCVHDTSANKSISILFIVLMASLCHGLNQVEDRCPRHSTCGTVSLCTWRPMRRPATKQPSSSPSLKVTRAPARAWPFQIPAPRPFTTWRRTMPRRLAPAARDNDDDNATWLYLMMLNQFMMMMMSFNLNHVMSLLGGRKKAREKRRERKVGREGWKRRNKSSERGKERGRRINLVFLLSY